MPCPVCPGLPKSTITESLTMDHTVIFIPGDIYEKDSRR